MSSPAPSTRLPFLDGMRGIAAIGVLLYHAHNLFGVGDFVRGYLCVDFFFLLSGYVLTCSAERHMTDAAAARRFLHGRVRRLWPMIALGVVLGAARAEMAGASLPLTVLLASAALVMVPYLWSPAPLYPLNGPQWSLLMELAANAAHACVLRHLGTRALLAATAIMGVLLGLAIAHYGADTFGPDSYNVALAVPRVLFPYMTGMLLARWPRPATTGRDWWLGAVLLVAVVLAVPMVPGVAAGDIVATLVLLPGVFWISLRSRPPVAAHRALATLGALSFPLYAIQMPVLLMFERLGHRPSIALAAIACALLASHGVAVAGRWPLRSRRAASPPACPPQGDAIGVLAS